MPVRTENHPKKVCRPTTKKKKSQLTNERASRSPKLSERAQTKKVLDARGIRTPNLGVWNPTRYRCAIASNWKLATRQAGRQANEQATKFFLPNKKVA